MSENKKKNGKVVSLINMKGGVGKTTICLGIGEFLANYKDKKILFIDIDPQFNLTQSLMNEFDLEELYLEEYSNTKTVKKLLESPTTVTERQKTPTKEDIIINLNKNMDIVAGTINLILEDNKTEAGKIKKINKFINTNKLKEEYDYILIDCPPTITLYTDAALYASDYYLVPNKIDRYSLLGITLLKQVIDRLKDVEDLKIMGLGVVHTMLEEQTLKTLELREKIEQSEVVKNLGLFKSNSHYVKDLLVGYQGNISSKYQKSKDNIKNISEEFIDRIEKMELTRAGDE